MSDKKIFISHSSSNKEIADMLLDFLAAMGISKKIAFCSSLPGNDSKHKISQEIKEAIQNSVLNIVILSDEYYQSVYCLNEQGIIWFHNTPVIVIAMPEIQPDSMHGFLNSEYKIRRFDNEDDIIAIYDQIMELFSISIESVASLNREIKKLIQNYNNHIASRNTTEKTVQKIKETNLAEITDDEKVILYYILSHEMRKVTKSDITKWLIETELCNINVANAFDILNASSWGTLTISEENEPIFELEISKFRGFTKNTTVITNLEKYVNHHCYLSRDKFIEIWNSGQFDDSDLLFIAYIIDKNVTSFGSRWMEKQQIEDIQKWEKKEFLVKGILSKNYSECLDKFIKNNFVHASAWTDYGNPKTYILYKSIKTFFIDNFPYKYELETTKKRYVDLPF